MSEHRGVGLEPPATTPPRRSRLPGWGQGALAIGLLASAALIAAQFLSNRTRENSDSAPPVLDLNNADFVAAELPRRDPGYVGPQVCAECHRDRVSACLGSTHFRACREPVAAEMPAGFAPGAGEYQSQIAGLRFEMLESSGSYLQQTFDATAGPEQFRSARVDYLYGVGNADSVFLSWEGNRLYELPIVWLYTQNRWAASHFYPYRGGSFGRELNPRCLECHNTWFDHLAGTLNEYHRDEIVLGVTCERCHGPGREHVEHHRRHTGLERGEAIVHPGRLSRERLIEVCTQCHSNAIKHLGPAFNYRPGEPLDQAYKTLQTEFPEYDHVANQIQYLRQSRCFQQSDSMTCVTCHDPHQRPLPAGVTSSQHSCLTCHQPADCHEQSRLPEEVRANCVGCHLPPIIKINVNFQTSDDDYVPPLRRFDHRIAVHPHARDTVLWEWYRPRQDTDSQREAERLARSLVERHLAEARRNRAGYRFLAAIAACREAVRIESTAETSAALHEAVATQARLDADWNEALHALQQNRLADAIRILEGVIAVKPDLARAHTKLGTTLAAAGDTARSREHLQLAAKLDPDDPNAEAMLGWLAYLKDQSAEALDHYERAMKIEPYDADVTYPYGLVLERLGRFDDALAAFRRLLKIDPRHVNGAFALSRVLRHKKNFDEATVFAWRAVALTRGDDVEMLVNLAETCLQAGDPATSTRAANSALAATSRLDPQSVVNLRRRLEDLGVPYTRARKQTSK